MCVCVEKVSAGQLVTQPFWVVQTLVGYCITVQLRRENPRLRREGGKRTLDEVKTGDEERCVVCCFCFVYHLFWFGFFFTLILLVVHPIHPTEFIARLVSPLSP